MNTTNTKLKRTHSKFVHIENKTEHVLYYSFLVKIQTTFAIKKRRRDLFSQLIGNLEDILSIDKISLQDDQTTKTSPQTNKLDKASILRETACYFRKHHDELIIEINISSSRSRTTTDDIADMVKFSWKPPSNIVMSEEWIQTAIESMNCFLLVTKSDPDNAQTVYVSNHISSLLIREKLSEYRIRKQAEIRVREEEIKVIENIIKFINEFELKRSKALSSKPINSYTSNHLTGDTASSSPLNQRLKSYYPTTLIISSSLNEIIDDSSVRFSSIIFRHNSSADHPNVRSSNDETIFDQLTNSLFSPQQETFSLSSPLTSFATVSTFLLIPSIRLSLSPIRTITTTTTTTIESSQSSSSIEPITATTTITNADMISTEKSPRKSSFKHSLPPNSLVS
ncbi:unnamed protein product [Rotaria socialis]|uniref:BHLH domain-containing protein n=1 Tax=Rotaria socialis TaxID=392032 RepID=A0A819CED1_9BILA|nr:unnamed protein product [Rotaria socialis]